MMHVKSESIPMTSEDGFILRIRGLPWQSTREEIASFFKGCKIRDGINGIFMTLSREGRPSGEAYVEMDSEDDYKHGLEFNRQHLGNRYIEVFPSKRTEMEWMCRRQGTDATDMNHTMNEESFVRLRGLPFNCTRDDISDFFSGLDIVPDGIVMPTDHPGRSTGEAYIQFATRDFAEKAMGKHKEKIGHRYIEIFKSSFQEYRAVKAYMDSKRYPSSNYGHDNYGPSHDPMPPNQYQYHKMRLGHPTRPSPYPDRFRGGSYGGGGGGYGPPISGASRGPPPGTSRRMPPFDYDDDFRGRPPPYPSRYPFDSREQNSQQYPGRHTIHMRGLPYKTSEGEIFEFFLPLRPVWVRILSDDIGRPSGEADVEFQSHEDAVKAMNKDKAYIQKRYIELFLHSSPSSGPNSQNTFGESVPQRYNSSNNGSTGPMGGWESAIMRA